MIVSHKYKFIFIKNVKVASSSMEIALSKFCGPDDIITLIDNGGTDDKTRKKLGYPGPQHHNGFWCHDDAEKIKKRVGDKVWNEYYKFSFIRNPWDTAISKYFWVLKGKEWDNEVFKKEILRLDINNFLQKNINRISVNGKVSMDDVFKYENMGEALKIIKEKLNLPENIEMPNAKGQYRVGDNKKHYSNFYDNETIEIVRNGSKNIIDLFGYEFEDKRHE